MRDKFKRIKEQNIADVLTNYGNISNIYPFLVQEDIPYIKDGQLTKDFYSIPGIWRNQDSSYLEQNFKTVVNNDDVAYYPPSADNINFSNIKVNSINVSRISNSFSIEVNYTNYGYEKSTANMSIVIINSSGNTIDSGGFATDELNYLESSSSTYNTTISVRDTYTIKVYQMYNGSIEKNIYTYKITT
jgi:hypothetical protein